MASAVRMPQLGESVTEGTVVRWLKQPGEHVAEDESLAEIETEKVNVEIPSPFEGTLTELLVPEGETVAVGVVIATIDTGLATQPGSVQPPAIAPASQLPENAPPAATSVSEVLRKSPVATFSATGPLAPAGVAHGMFSTGESGLERPSPENGQPALAPRGDETAEQVPHTAAKAQNAIGVARYSPAVLRLASEHGIDLAAIQGTGLGGRISRKDVQALVNSGAIVRGILPDEGSRTQSDATALAPAGSEVVQEMQRSFAAPESAASDLFRHADGAGLPAEARPAQAVGDDEVLEPLTATRRAIAAHMSRSVQKSPHAWMMVEVDLSPLVAYRQQIKNGFRESEGIDLSYLPFMIKATVAALKLYPRLNSSWSDAGIVLKRRINIGIAVDTPAGLVVPVIKDADRLSISGLARAVSDLATRARARKLRIDDIEGGTFTVDNVGPIGSIISQPIINQPQCAIVTMESIVKRPVVIADAIAIRSMMNCCISFDHRIVDGGDIGPFMNALKQNLEKMGDGTPVF